MAPGEGRVARARWWAGARFISVVAVATWWGCAQVAGRPAAPPPEVELTAAETPPAATPRDEQAPTPLSPLPGAPGDPSAEGVPAGQPVSGEVSDRTPRVSGAFGPSESRGPQAPERSETSSPPSSPAPSLAVPAEGSRTEMPPLPPLPPGLEPATLGPLAGPGRAEAEQTSVLWLEADEYGQLAQTDTQYVLFYPLRYHGGFNVTVERGLNMESIKTVVVAPVAPDKDIQLIVELKNVLGLEATHYSSLNLLIIRIPVEKTKEYVRRVKDLLDVLDAPRKQVAIEAKIVEISRDVEIQLGVDWTATNSASDFFRSGRGNLDMPGSPNFGANDFNVRFDTAPSGGHVRLDATLRALEAASKLNVISEPNMVVEVGQTARILVGERVPVMTKWTGAVGTEQVTTELEPIGVRLFVTPLVVSEDTIRMHVMPQVSVVKQFRVTSSGIENPVIDTRDAETVVSVQDGEFIKIGGLLSSSKIKNEVKVPLLGDLPFLGFLFKSWRYQDINQDLIIYITPRIVRGPLIQPGAGVPFMGAGY